MADEMTLEQRVVQLQAAQVLLDIRHEAAIWLLEQMTANLLLNDPRADAFLDGLTKGPPHLQRPEPISDEVAAQLLREVERLANRVRRRMLEA